MGVKVCILRDSNPDNSLKWELACEKLQVQYKTVNMLSEGWLREINSFQPDFCVCRPPGDVMKNKEVFDSRLYFLEKNEGYLCYPGFNETFIYENKATLASFLETAKLPHPVTFVSHEQKEALTFTENTQYPLVAKTLIGASGSGVKIIKDKNQAKAYIKLAFGKGIRRRFGPNKNAGNPKSWLKKALRSPAFFRKKLKQYSKTYQNVEKGVVLFQEFIQHDFEWRLVKIGESFFAYKKLKAGEKSSGSKLFEYGPPPTKLLGFTKDLCDRFRFNFMAVDLFHNERGIFINELQTIFGHKNSYICKVDEQPGRYIYNDGQWVFEPGNFNTNESYDLRLQVANELYKKNKR